MGVHLIDGKFQSDKYSETPRGKVPLSCADKTAQDLLWEYAQRHRKVDAEFSEDLEVALRNEGFDPRTIKLDHAQIVDGPKGIEWLREEIEKPTFGTLNKNGVRKLLAYIDQLQSDLDSETGSRTSITE